MDDVTLLVLAAASVLGLVAALSIIRRERKAESMAATAGGPAESQFAVSTEGMKRCPACGMGNLVTDATCSSCGKRLPG